MIKLPRGTQDYSGESYEKLSYLKKIIEELFKKYHASFIITPIFERTDVLMNKYGEEEKLIYNIESDKSEKSNLDNNINDDNINNNNTDDDTSIGSAAERLSIRYDLTIPLVRYCIMNKIDKMRRGCIDKVCRRESTTKSQIRLREFFQADFDYVGKFDDLVPELEIFCMIQELFKKLSIDNYQILYNYRQNLDYYVREAGINPSMFSTVCSSIDKLDKKCIEEVRLELLQKGLTTEQIDILYEFLFPQKSTTTTTTTTPKITMSPLVREIDAKFQKYLGYIGIIDKSKIKLVPTLARGSDYYTGIIFEVKLINSDISSSVVGGGRYDKLIPSYRKSEKLSDRLSDRQTDNMSDGQTDNMSDRQTDNMSDGQTDNMSDRQTDNMSDRQTDNMSDRQTNKKKSKKQKKIRNTKDMKDVKDVKDMKESNEFPMIGFSFGMDRLLPLVRIPYQDKKLIKIWVSTIGSITDSVKIKLDLIGKLSQKGYGVFYNLSERKFKKEIKDADENGCNYVVIIGEREWADGNILIKNMMTREQKLINFNDIDLFFG
jgi:histidyl-tRNA synthetase